MMEFTANYNHNACIRVFPGNDSLAGAFLEFLSDRMKAAEERGDKFHLALSGGSTPSMIYNFIPKWKGSFPSLKHVHFYWSDERMVPASSPESNYGNALRELFSRINPPVSNIHPVRGENPVGEEILRYRSELSELPQDNGIPVFDLIILGLGDDGHTASLFPGYRLGLTGNKTLIPAKHPITGQQRISFSLRLINHAREIAFLTGGKSKRKVVEIITGAYPSSRNMPARMVNPVNGKIQWFLDKDAWTS